MSRRHVRLSVCVCVCVPSPVSLEELHRHTLLYDGKTQRLGHVTGRKCDAVNVRDAGKSKDLWLALIAAPRQTASLSYWADRLQLNHLTSDR